MKSIVYVCIEIKSTGLKYPSRQENDASFNCRENADLVKCFEDLVSALPEEWLEWSKSDLQVPSDFANHFKSSLPPFDSVFFSQHVRIEQGLKKNHGM